MKGGFGGGFAIIGIPLLSIVMDPLTAGAFLAPLFIVQDLVALRYWKPSTWSQPDLGALLPALVVGIAAGFVTLGFTALWFRSGGQVTIKPRSTPKAIAAGFGSGLTTMVAHSGGPPLAMYLLPRGLSKELYAGTTSIFFTVGNLIKAVPWLLIVRPASSVWILMAICLLAIPSGIWLGWKMQQRLDQQQLYRACYALLVVTAAKLLWDGVHGYLH